MVADAYTVSLDPIYAELAMERVEPTPLSRATEIPDPSVANPRVDDEPSTDTHDVTERLFWKTAAPPVWT